MGVLYGDGWTYKRTDGAYVTCIDQTERNSSIIISEVVPRLRGMGFNAKPYRFYAKHDHTFKWRTYVYSKELFLELKKTFPRIESYLNGLSAKDSKQFIAGMIDAEGTVSDRLVIYNKNTALLEAIKRKLDEFGISHSHIYRYGVVHGLYVFRRKSLESLVGEIPAVKLQSLKRCWLEKASPR